MADEAAVHLLELLKLRGETFATAESLTGGLLGQLVTTVPGSSGAYRGGAIAYAADVKHDLLGVSSATIRTHGVVSAECALEMAEGARKAFGADWAVSTTGVAGPERQEDKPVGMVFVGVSGPEGASTRELRVEGDREGIRRTTCQEALLTLIETVNRSVGPTP